MIFVSRPATGTSGKSRNADAPAAWGRRHRSSQVRARMGGYRMKRVLVLGASGMLGSMVVDVLSRDVTLMVSATVRDERLAATGRRRLPGVNWQVFDVGLGDGVSPLPVLDGQQWVINCIGITKQTIRDDRPADVERAIRVNALFPHLLGAAVGPTGGRMIQIATDCVFSGRRGGYTEEDAHDPLDVYGKTKSLGEARQEQVHHLRCSIIGPEPKGYKFLLEWFLRQPRGAQVRGFVNHRWNGLTTLHFARICLGVITAGFPVPVLQHVVATSTVTKAEMLRYFASAYGREDVQIMEVETPEAIDRTLATTGPSVNAAIWRHAGYAQPPTVPAMIRELSQFDYRFGELAAPARHVSP